MLNGKKILAIIPARGGSKGLPNKNIRILLGKPLIHWTIEKARLSKYIDEIIVSTDSQIIADVAKQTGIDIPFLRPKDLAEDITPMYEVIIHILNYYNNLNRKFDLLVLLEPTSPLREDNDIDIMLEKLVYLFNRYNAIVSIGEVSEHPSLIKKILSDDVIPFCKDLKMSLRRQDNERAFFPYGVAYISKVESFLEEKTFYQTKTTYHLIKRYQNYEIDDLYDFLAIENIMKHEWSIK